MKTGLNINDLEVALDVVRHEKKAAVKEYIEILETETIFRKYPYLKGFQNGKIEVLEEVERILANVLKESMVRHNLTETI